MGIYPIIQNAVLRKLSNGPISGTQTKFPAGTKLSVFTKSLAEFETKTVTYKEKGNQVVKDVEIKVDEGKVKNLKQKFITGSNVSRTSLQQCVNKCIEDL